MTLNKHHIAILRRLALGTPGTVYGLSKSLTLENALVSNLSQQLADVKFLRKAENDLLKITENGERVLKCIAKNESYDHLLPAASTTTAPVSSAEDINSLCTAKQPDSESPHPADPELMQRVLLVLFKASKSIGVSKTAEQVNAKHIPTKGALDQLVAQGHVKKYSGGSYYITASGRNLVLQASTPAEPDEGQLGGALDAAWSASCNDASEELAAAWAGTLEEASQIHVRLATPDHDADLIDVDTELDDLVQRGLVHQQGEHYTLPDSAVITGFNFEQMANEFEQEQSSQDHPVIDDISAKERALSYCSLLLSPHSTELKRCIDALQMDLAVIRLHQERRA